jgi:putative transposase
VIVALKSTHELEDLLRISKVARSTFYYHAGKLNAPDKHAELKAVISKLFEENRARYGHRRIWLKLRALGWQVTKKLVHKLMNQLGLRSKVRVKRKYNSYKGTQSVIAPNLLAREFDALEPNLKWVSDVTEFRVRDEKVYLSPVLDLFDHSIVGYNVATSPNIDLTGKSLRNAFNANQPKAGLLVHTDQGFQYQHAQWRKMINDHKGVQSMSRKANCHDNAVMENFFGHLKAEMFHGETFKSANELIAEIDSYIDWYNNERVQEKLKGMTPMQYRNHALQTQAA